MLSKQAIMTVTPFFNPTLIIFSVARVTAYTIRWICAAFLNDVAIQHPLLGLNEIDGAK